MSSDETTTADAPQGPDREGGPCCAWFSRHRALSSAAVVAALAMGWCAYCGYQAYRQRDAVAAIRALDGKITYADELPLATTWWGERVLAQWLGRDFATAVVVVKLNGAGIDDADLRCLSPLNGLIEVHITDSENVTDAGLACLHNKGSLEKLCLRGSHIGDAGLAHLAGLKGMKFLDLEGTSVSDAGLTHIKDLPQLRGVNLLGTRVSQEAAAQLRTERRDAFVKR